MRVWLDPDKIATLGMTAGDVVAAIRAQNLQITGGQIAGPPIADRAFQPNLTFTGRLKDVAQFEDIVVKAGEDGRTVRLRDVARIELGALDYSTNSFMLRKTAVADRDPPAASMRTAGPGAILSAARPGIFPARTAGRGACAGGRGRRGKGRCPAGGRGVPGAGPYPLSHRGLLYPEALNGSPRPVV